jgi:zinc transport system ATP-binding protein
LKNKTQHQIECRGVSLSYDGKTVLSDVNFSVSAGDYLCIVGENGSGKSTLIKALNSLKKPSGGEILFGEGISGRNIGYLPQQTSFQKDFPAKVKEIVMSGCLGRGSFSPFYRASDKKRAFEAMEKMGISDISEDSFSALSGGQRQRVILARALCAAEKILLLDEPVTGLDPASAKELYSLISSLNKNDGMTVIMVSHDVGHSLKYANKILHLDKSVKFFGTKEDYLNSSALGALTGGEDDE